MVLTSWFSTTSSSSQQDSPAFNYDGSVETPGATWFFPCRILQQWELHGRTSCQSCLNLGNFLSLLLLTRGSASALVPVGCFLRLCADFLLFLQQDPTLEHRLAVMLHLLYWCLPLVSNTPAFWMSTTPPAGGVQRLQEGESNRGVGARLHHRWFLRTAVITGQC